MGRKIVKIAKVGFYNKGAELMMIAAAEAIRARYGNEVRPAVDLRVGSWAQRRQYELHTVIRFRTDRYRWIDGVVRTVGNLVPNVILSPLNLAPHKNVKLVLDCSGFSYSDQWGAKSSRDLLERAQQWTSVGAKIILMPQAFGPFQQESTRTAFLEATRFCDLIFPRDRVSLDHLKEIGVDESKLQLAPDFTFRVRPINVTAEDTVSDQICLVPNYRMIDKGGNQTLESYCRWLGSIVDHAQSLGLNAFILVHDRRSDLIIGRELVKRFPRLTMVEEPDPRRIKAILASSRVVIGSRFHALASALYAAVPTIGSGWSHKYVELFRQFGMEDYLIEPSNDNTEVLLDQLVRNQSVLKDRMRRASAVVDREIERMWERIWRTAEK